MTKDEFLYDHDLSLITDLINREQIFRNSESDYNQMIQQPERARDLL